MTENKELVAIKDGKRVTFTYDGSVWSTEDPLDIFLLEEISNFFSGGLKEDMKKREVTIEDLKDKL